MKKAKLLMAMMLIGCLTSCSDGSNLNSTNSQDKGSISESSQSGVTSSETSTSNQSEGSSQGSISDATVSESEWQEIFDSFTISNGTLISHANYEGSGIVMTIEAETPTKIHLISSTTFGDSESYEENILYKDEEDYYIYARESAEDKYTRTLVDEETFNNRLSSSASPLLMLSAQLEMVQIKDNFEQFTYDAAQNAYVGTLVGNSQGNEMTLNFVIKFENNSPVSIACANEDNTSVSTYSNFGTTTVTIPTDFNENSGNDTSDKITEAEWQEVIQTFAEEKNFSLEQKSDDTIIGAMKQVGTTYYEIYDDNESERIFTIEDSNYYIYSKSSSDEQWSKDITTQERYQSKMEYSLDLVIGAATAFAQSYDAFEYQNDGVYFASEIAVPDSYTLKNIKISFDDDNHVSEVECTIDDYGILISIHDIGSTSITIPSVYNDNTIGN